jgi:hypothetical protein
MSTRIQKLGYSVLGAVVGGVVLSVGVVYLWGNVTQGYLLEGLIVGILLGLQPAQRQWRKDIWLGAAIVGVMTIGLLIFNSDPIQFSLPSIVMLIQSIFIVGGVLASFSWAAVKFFVEDK